MISRLRALLLMLLGPPLALLLWAHLVRPAYSGWDWPAIVVAGLLGIVEAATVPLHGKIKWAVAVAYALLLVATLPFVGLVAVCTTGDCL